MLVLKPVELIYRQMWGTPLEQIAALYFGLMLSHLVAGDSSTSAPKNLTGIEVKVLYQLGESAYLPCSYHYEDQRDVPQLSVQWKSPNNELLCHYIKHKSFKNCTEGYSINYSPGDITLFVRRVIMADFGTHVCSVSKPHEFSDNSVELVQIPDSATSAPKSGWNQSGPAWTLILLHTLWLFVCM